MTITHRELDLGMSLFLELVQADPSLAPAVAEAKAEYFPGGGVFCGDPRDAPAAEVRFFEWLLFERDHAGSLLIQALMPAWREMATPELAAREETFLETCVGIFEVGESSEEGLHWLRDIAGLGEYAVELRIPEGAAKAGDLIVGRLFPRGDSAHVLSPAAGCFREEPLLAAVYQDLENARDLRSHKALRIGQVDLEAMFWGPSATPDSPDPVAQLRAFLEDGGLGSDEIDGLIETLSERPVPTEATDLFIISSLGDLLDHFAFESDIDLSLAQEKFLACWLHLHEAESADSSREAKTSPSDRIAPRKALSAFDEDREAGMDAQTAISRLSARLGVDLDVDTDMAEEGCGPGIALVPGLIAEYLWELEQLEGAEAASRQTVLKRALPELQDVQVFEDLSAQRLLLLGCTMPIEEDGLTRGQRVEAVQAIGRFCAWCSEQHGLEASPVATRAFETLPDSMGRISEANEALVTVEPGGVWQQVQMVDGALAAVDSEGIGKPLSIPDASMACLQEGDFVRGEFAEARFSVRWCYPPELEAAR